MKLYAGTSGFSYKEWLGAFYPEKLPAKAMLEHFASRLPAVEINNTFYRMPSAALLAGWRAQVPPTFRFAVKAPRRITHIKRLAGCGGEMQALWEALRALEPCLGAVLFQLPPHAKRDTGVLAAFLDELPAGCPAAFEFRNASWHVPEVLELLERRNFALVQSETDDAFVPLPFTADWAYLRLRKVAYTRQDLAAWLERLRAANLREAHVYFKHEDEATGPRLASELLALASS